LRCSSCARDQLSGDRGDPAYAGVRSELLALCMHYARVLGDDDFAFE
jgi:hypothetical protein